VLGVCLTPIVLVAVALASYLTLDRDAAVLRREVAASTQATWETQAQFSIGRFTLAAVRSGLWFVDVPEADEVRRALAAVRRASVGVYELASPTAPVAREAFFNSTDRAMQARGWTRLVGVADGRDHVLIYVEDTATSEQALRLCLAVLSDRELVVVSTAIDPTALQELVDHHAPAKLRAQVRQLGSL
jgi:hypothetical protein